MSYNNPYKENIQEDRMQYALLQFHIIGAQVQSYNDNMITLIHKGETVIFGNYILNGRRKKVVYLEY